MPRPSLERVEPSVREQLDAALVGIETLSTEDAGPKPGVAPTALADALGDLGRLYHAYRFERAAVGAYARAEALDPEDPAWPYLRAAIHQRDRQLEWAEGALRRALELEPDDVPSRLRLAQVLRLSGRGVEAESLLRELLALPALASLAGARAVALYELGRLAAADGRLTAAADLLGEALGAAPAASAVRQHLGLVYRRLGDLDLAREQLARAGPVEPTFEDPWAVGLLPSGATARLLMGNRAFRRGDFDAALAHHRAAHTADPANPAVLRALALTLERKGEERQALELYREAHRRAPEDPLLAYDLARAVLAASDRAAGEERRAGLTALRRAVELAPAYQEARLLLGAQEAESGRLEAAAAQFLAVLELSPGHPQARQGLALTALHRADQHLATGDRAAAVGRLERAVELDPELIDARSGLAVLLLAEGRHGESATHFEAAAELVEVADAGRAAPEALTWLLEAARIRAASPVAEVRDGRRALELAQRVFEAAPSPDSAEVMAMAFAATGAFEKAIAWQARLLGQAGAAGAPAPYLARLERNLERYRGGRVADYPEPSPSPDS
ncbi:MAG: tetratricopeptide repeat protein [Holophagales bacterium]|nr:tetratricopeptide repeat protein [Holophagales bacterium]